jgi:hypothetical protein
MEQKYNAYHGNETFRQQMIDAAAEHMRLDHYISGTYGESGSPYACSVGCSVRSVNKLLGKRMQTDSHAGLAKELGVPEFITRLQDRIFEGLPSGLRPAWTGRLFAAIRPGVDLSPVLPLFLLRALDGLPEQSRADVVAAIKGVREVLQAWADTGAVDQNAANAAYAAANAAANAAYAAANAANAAYAAAYAAANAAYAAYAANAAYAAANAAAYAAANAAYAAYAAANAAAYAAANAAAYAAAYAAADANAASASYERMANDLLEIIEKVCDKQGQSQ